MRTTVILDDDLLREVKAAFPGRTQTDLVAEGFRALLRQDALVLLAEAGGKAPHAQAAPRRRVDL